MKTKIKQTPALLGEPPTSWLLEVTTKDYQTTMTFNNKSVASEEYNRIKNSSIYAGQWISEITLKDVA
jgi:hypothetical protein